MRSIFVVNGVRFTTREAADGWILERMRPAWERATDFENLGSTEREQLRQVGIDYAHYSDQDRQAQREYLQSRLNEIMDRARATVDMGFEEYARVHGRHYVEEVAVMETVAEAGNEGY